MSSTCPQSTANSSGQPPVGNRLLLGVEGPHGSDYAQRALDGLLAWIMAYPGMPLLPGSLKETCLMAPPEVGGGHFQAIFITADVLVVRP